MKIPILHRSFRPRFALLASMVGGLPVLLCASPSPTQAAQGAETVAAIPADVQKTMEQIGDLDLLVALTPLKLTPAQIDTVLTALKSIAREGDAKSKKDYELMRALAADVAKARAGMLAGKSLDADLETRINKTNADMAARYDAARSDAATRIAQTLKETLTAEQDTMIDGQFTKLNKGHLVLPASLRSSTPAKIKEFVHGLALESFADRILLPDRSIALLTALKNSSADTTVTPPPAAAPPPPTAK